MKATRSILFIVLPIFAILSCLAAYRHFISGSNTLLYRSTGRGSLNSVIVYQNCSSESTNGTSLCDSNRKSSPEFFPSKYVIVRAVYYDDRPRDGHQNAAVFIVMVWKNITDKKWITGCRVGNHTAKDYSVNLIGETPKWRAYPSYNKIDHEEVLVHCFDLPVVRNAMDGYLFYKTSEDSVIQQAVSERPLSIPAPRIPPRSPEGLKYKFTVMTCTKIFDKPPWLREWIEYQRTIGIDHIHINMDDSFIRNSKPEDLHYLQSLIDEGFLSTDVWIMWLRNGVEIWYHNQGLILEDCVYRYRTTYDHIFVLDTDDFFTPRVPGEPKVHYYLNKYCREDHTGSCKLRWIEFFPDHYHLRNTPTVGGNVTDRILNYTHYVQPNRKSVHRPNTVVDCATHYAHKLIEGYHIKEVPPSVAYVAHVRKGKHPDFNAKHSIVSKVGMP